jgi:hypothetical protein
MEAPPIAGADSEIIKFAANSPWRDKEGIAAHFGVSPRLIADWMRLNYIPYHKVGKLVRFHISKCEEALARNFEIKAA